ncbi:hypothetical protein GCM10010924_22160 [Rhizobium wenxiniae]|nr:hypothetical protein GCM10010924_22160 [Rhizobium wenxiniae]
MRQVIFGCSWAIAGAASVVAAAAPMPAAVAFLKKCLRSIEFILPRLRASVVVGIVLSALIWQEQAEPRHNR